MESRDVSLLITIIIVTLVALLIGTSMFWSENAETYTTNKITECNDNDGDLIEGLTCYETIECADVFKFFNPNGCEDVTK